MRITPATIIREVRLHSEIMGKTRTIQVKVSDWEYRRYARLADELTTTLSELGRDALMIALPTFAKRAKILQEKPMP